MLKPKILLIDTNVWIDFFLGREPQCSRIRRLFELHVANGGSLLYAPTTLKDVFYLIPRILRRDASSAESEPNNAAFRAIAWACIETMTEIAAAAPQSLAECELAWMLRGEHGDLEDNLIIASAETCNADYVVTYDRALIEHFAPACVSPEQLVSLLEKSVRQD